MKDQADKLRQIIDDIKFKQNDDNFYTPHMKKRTNAKVITVCSGKGGVGKTNISVNMAIALSQMGYRVTILDVDFGLANIDVLFGIVPRYTLFDVMYNDKNILEVLTNGPNNIKFLSGGSGIEELVKLKKYHLEKFVNNIALLDKLYDIILIDTGAGISDNVMSFVIAADEVVLVTTPEPTSITDAYALIKMIAHRDKHKKVKVIVNRADSIQEASDIQKKLTMVSEKFLSLKLYHLGYILNDEFVSKAVKQQKPFSISYPRCPASKQVWDIAARISDLSVSDRDGSNEGVKTFFSKVIRFFNAG